MINSFMYGIQGYSVAGTLSQLRSVVKPRGPLMWPDLRLCSRLVYPLGCVINCVHKYDQ